MSPVTSYGHARLIGPAVVTVPGARFWRRNGGGLAPPSCQLLKSAKLILYRAKVTSLSPYLKSSLALWDV